MASRRSLVGSYPTNGQVRDVLSVWDGSPAGAITRMRSAVRSQTGTPQKRLDWSDPDTWIGQRLQGEAQEWARRTWQGTGKRVSPRYLDGHWRLVHLHRLLQTNAHGNLQLTAAGLDFREQPEGETVREIDRDQGLLHLLRLLGDAGSASPADLLVPWLELLRAETSIRAKSTARAALSSRLRNLEERGYLNRSGRVLSVTASGNRYLCLAAAPEEGAEPGPEPAEDHDVRPPANRLVLERSDNPQGAIVLAPGSSILIGGGPECDLRLPGGPEVVARLDVTEGFSGTGGSDKKRPGLTVVSYVPYWQDGRGHCREDPGARTELEVGNTLHYAGIMLSFRELEEPVKWPLWLHRLHQLGRRLEGFLFPAKRASERERRRRKEDLKLLSRPSGQSPLMARLGAIIDPEEATAARAVFGRARQAAYVFVPAALAFFAALLFFAPPGLTAALAALIGGLLITMVATTFFFAPVGAIVLTAAGMTASLLAFWQEDADVGYLFAILYGFIGFLIGRRCEDYWLPVPSEDRLDKGLEIVGLAFALLWLAIVDPSLGPSGQLAAGGSSLLVLIWSLWLVPHLQHRLLDGSNVDEASLGPLRLGVAAPYIADTITLVDAVARRWQRRLTYRWLAVALALLPVLVILNGLDLRRQRSTFGEGDRDQAILLWTETGEQVTQKLLERERFYVLSDDEWGSREGVENTLFGVLAPVGEDGKSLFGEFQATRLDDLPGNEEGTWNEELWLWVVTGEKRDPTGQLQEELHRATIWSTSRSEIDHRTRISWLLAPAGLLLTFLGVLVLWRAPGLGSVELLASLWAFGAGGLVTLASGFVAEVGPYAIVALNEARFVLEKAASQGLVPFLFLGIFWIVVVALLLLVAGIAFGVLPGLLAALWLWPERPVGWKGGSRITAQRCLVLLSIVAPVVAGFLVARVAGWIAGWLVGAVALALLVRARSPVGRRQFPASLSLLALLLLPAFLFVAGLGAIGSRSHWWMVAILGLSACLAAALFDLLVVKNLWNLARGRAATTVLIATVVPLMIFAIKRILEEQVVTHRLLPPGATDIAALILFGLYFERLVLRSNEIVEQWLSPRLRGLARSLPVVLEQIERCATASDRHRELVRTLESEPIGIGRFILYSNRGNADGTFAVIAGRSGDFVPPALELSGALLADLALTRRFINVSDTVGDAEFAATAPELWRVRRRLGKSGAGSEDGSADVWRCEYLLPVTRGSRVVGLLIVGSGQLDDSARSDFFGHCLAEICLAAL